MTNLLKAFSVAAGVSAAVLAIAASAQAEPMNATETGSVRIHVADLDLNSARGRAVFDARVQNAARAMCADESDWHLNIACRRVVSEEAYANLHEQQEQIARTGSVHIARMGRR